MAHIHEKIDFTVAIFVVHDGKILLIHHRKLDKWLPLGGHIELEEDPEQAALREAKEESGFDVELLGERPPTTSPGTRALIAPRFLDIHRINDTHEHIGMIYWARPKNGIATKPSRKSPAEHRFFQIGNWKFNDSSPAQDGLFPARGHEHRRDVVLF